MMKCYLFQIPAEGLRRDLSFPAHSLPRLSSACGPQQGNITAELVLKQRGGNVEVKGTFKAALDVPCNRCLDPVPFHLEETLAVTLAPQASLEQMDEDFRLSEGDLEVSFFDGEEIDLGLLIEDELLLLVPESICDEDERGCCTLCGKNLEEMFKSKEPDLEDHPFAQLKQLIK